MKDLVYFCPSMNHDKALHILMVVDTHYPADIRVRKEAESLARFHKVSVLCKADNNAPEYARINEVEVYRKIKYKNIADKARMDILNALTGIHPRIHKVLHSFLQENTFEVIHVHDLPLANTVNKITKKLSVKRILDLHENYPEALQIWFQWRTSNFIRLKNRIFFNYSRWKSIEKKMLRQYDRIITVAEEMKNFLLSQHKIDANKILVVSNTENTNFFNNINLGHLPPVWKSFDGKYIISYIGGIGPHRGLQTLIKALPEICAAIPEAHVVVAGSGHPDNIKFLQSLSKHLEVEDKLSFIGHQDITTVPAMMKASDINIIPHSLNNHTQNTVPHKLFQIMMSGSPLLVSSVKPFERIVGNNRAGYVFQADDPKDLSRMVIHMHSHPDDVRLRIKKALEITRNGPYNWEETKKVLLSLYRDIY